MSAELRTQGGLFSPNETALTLLMADLNNPLVVGFQFSLLFKYLSVKAKRKMQNKNMLLKPCYYGIKNTQVKNTQIEKAKIYKTKHFKKSSCNVLKINSSLLQEI